MNQDNIKHLQAEIDRLTTKLGKCQRPGYHFEPQQEDVRDQLNNQYPYFRQCFERSFWNDGTGTGRQNLLIKGENLHALYALSLKSGNKETVDVIYIDPPYNTGKEFVYNDKRVDKENSKVHTSWMSFMRRRLYLARDLLKRDGVIYVSIDDNEVHRLRILMDDIFGEDNFVAQMIWQKSPNPNSQQKSISTVHEYVLCYARQKDNLSFRVKTNEDNYKFEDEKGKYATEQLYNPRFRRTPTLLYGIELPDGTIGYPTPSIDRGCWTCSEDTYKKRLAEGRIIFKETKTPVLQDENGNPLYYRVFFKRYLDDTVTRPSSLLLDYGYSSTGTTNLKDAIGDNEFDYPKPVELIKHLISITNKADDITVLDFFGGSGTTAQAVSELNEEDGGNRRFILITNNENDIFDKITYERVKATNKNNNVDVFVTELDDIPTSTTHEIHAGEVYNLAKNLVQTIAIRHEMSEIHKTVDNEHFSIYSKNGRTYAFIWIFKRTSRNQLKQALSTITEPITLYGVSAGEHPDYRDMFKELIIDTFPKSVDSIEIYPYNEYNILKQAYLISR